jgi:hypothetical protein
MPTTNEKHSSLFCRSISDEEKKSFQMPPTILSSNFKLSFFSRNKNIKKRAKKVFFGHFIGRGGMRKTLSSNYVTKKF